MTKEEAKEAMGKLLGFSDTYDEAYRTIFQEPEESEDERIVDVLFEMMNLSEVWKTAEKYGIKIGDIRRWIVKQKEPKGLDVTDFCQPIHPDIAMVLPDVINELTWGEDEQKPADPTMEDLERHQAELHDFKVFAAKQAKEHHISFVHDFEWNNFCGEILSYLKGVRKV